MTLDELYQLPDDELRHELVNGLLVSEPPPGVRHGRIAARIVSLLDAYVREHDAGVVLTCDTGFILHCAPDTVRAPDVAFVSLQRYLALEDERGAMPGAPDLAVEVLSPGDRQTDVHAKVADYLAAGTAQVWVVDAEAEQVVTYRKLFEPRWYRGAESIEAGDLLPGFCVRVDEIFATAEQR